MKWGGTDFKWGVRVPLALPLATALVVLTKSKHVRNRTKTHLD